MKTLQEHLDDLDRMVDTGASKPETRSQIAFVAREVAALEADYARLSQATEELEKTHAAMASEHAALKETQAQKHSDDWNGIARASHIEATYEAD